MTALRDLFKNPTTAELELLERHGRLPESAQRERNFEAFASTGLPHRRVEAWKWSDVRNALPELPDATGHETFDSPFEKVEGVITFTFNESGCSYPDDLPDGLRVFEQDAGQALGGAEELPLAALGAALASDPGVLMVEVSETINAPIHLNFTSRKPVQFSRIVFVLRETVKLSVYETHTRSGGFSSNLIEYGLEDGAELSRTLYQRAPKDAVQIFTGLVHLNAGAKLTQSGLGFGSKLCRNETRIFHHGEGAHATLNGAYLIGDGYHYDQTSLVRHSKPECQTEQLCKGAVTEGGRAVFQGKFYVARKAQQTAAQMGHHALLLEDGGEVDAKPELEIYADDVECAHGNTVGALDNDALFYLRQRGLSESIARAVLTEAFIAEALETAPEDVREALIEEARQWLMTAES